MGIFRQRLESCRVARHFDRDKDAVSRNATVSQVFDLLIEENASRKHKERQSFYR